MATFDPLPYWIVLQQPVFVVYGAEDERDNVPVAESVRRLESALATVGRTDARIVVVAGAGHAVLQPDDPTRLADDFTQALAAWLREHVTTRRPSS